jgi:hypothetical protein
LNAATKKRAKPSYLERARERWGDEIPAWVELLASEADRAPKLEALADRLSKRADWISAIVGKTYPGRLDIAEATVCGVLKASVVSCPAYGFEIGRDVCVANQQSKFSAASSSAAQFPRACKGCVHALTKESA